jgi:hypothetical protein
LLSSSEIQEGWHGKESYRAALAQATLAPSQPGILHLGRMLWQRMLLQSLFFHTSVSSARVVVWRAGPLPLAYVGSKADLASAFQRDGNSLIGIISVISILRRIRSNKLSPEQLTMTIN